MSEHAASASGAGTSASDPRLYCILITYRRESLVDATLRALLAQTHLPDLVLVVDNGQSAAVAQLVNDLAADGMPVGYLPSAENVGPAGGMHLGMTHLLPLARPQDWIMRVDDDHAPPYPALFAEMMGRASECVANDERTGAVGLRGARMNWRRGRLITPPAGDAGATWVDYLPTNFFPMYRMSAITAVGTFDPELFYGFEELEYGLRLRQSGYTLYRLDGLVPPRPITRAQLRLSEPVSWRRYYSLRNSIVIARRYGHPGSAIWISLVRGLLKPLVSFVITPATALRHLQANGRSMSDAWRGNLGKTWDPATNLVAGAELPPTPDRAGRQ